jgi:hypothetical protein
MRTPVGLKKHPFLWITLPAAVVPWGASFTGTAYTLLEEDAAH